MAKKIGTKSQVWHGSADHTPGGLKQHDLTKNKHGRIVSKKQQAAGKKAFARNNLKPKTAADLAKLRHR